MTDALQAAQLNPQITARRTSLAATPLRGYNSSMSIAVKTIRVQVLFFGRLKEIVGRANDSLNLAEGSSIEDLFAQYAGNPELARYRTSMVASCNQEFAAWSTLLRAGDEVAFLPPVSGG
jgi:molybdopterin synthase sulfur carrier subunit